MHLILFYVFLKGHTESKMLMTCFIVNHTFFSEKNVSRNLMEKRCVSADQRESPNLFILFEWVRYLKNPKGKRFTKNDLEVILLFTIVYRMKYEK